MDAWNLTEPRLSDHLKKSNFNHCAVIFLMLSNRFSKLFVCCELHVVVHVLSYLSKVYASFPLVETWGPFSTSEVVSIFHSLNTVVANGSLNVNVMWAVKVHRNNMKGFYMIEDITCFILS